MYCKIFQSSEINIKVQFFRMCEDINLFYDLLFIEYKLNKPTEAWYDTHLGQKFFMQLRTFSQNVKVS